MNIQELTNEELNRAMIWLNPPELGIFNDCERSGIWGDSDGKYTDHLDYLTDWSLTGPLAENGLLYISFDQSTRDTCEKVTYCESVCGYTSENKNPLRAICECVLRIAMKK